MEHTTMSQRHNVEMIGVATQGNNWDKFVGGTRFSKRKSAPQPGDSGYGILTSFSLVFFRIISLITILFSIYMQFHLNPNWTSI